MDGVESGTPEEQARLDVRIKSERKSSEHAGPSQTGEKGKSTEENSGLKEGKMELDDPLNGRPETRV